ncbi:methylenetetrahydrofolate reductase [NAD(P)H] [Marinibactrum halimedae]|uniref:Methylenetetrahydrofolate reductase n=1 Tax=Marinibactrum halimedae TaxID=1444977 RepID=A0AA37T4L8_9GAMM|nr:methylenetetrahydrofolate reductase [NAD(P)H] [Marinibactrum halimedae]MCD9458334.1 methylenetetrahydrofolate reductase [NAD(P)H] [Marinibactrum halimedae]GLS27038.1 methylenetetrahydrofolate reductase [Marinibactrum halimedae]
MSNTPRLSFEFFPPRTEQGQAKLHNVRDQLNQFQPEFFSVTYGAGGSTRDNTKNIVKSIREKNIAVAPHLSFGGDSEDAIKALLEDYKSAGVRRIVALRGDMPSGLGSPRQMVYANELVAFIREHFGEHFHLEVAAYPEIHPEAKSYDDDIRYLKGKFDAGANSGITQYFFNPDAYFYFMDQCQAAGITQPIYPGIMPITNFQNLTRFSDSCGAEIPRWVRKRLDAYGDDTDSIKAFGIDLITDLCDMLLDNDAPGLHFYTMNQAEPTSTIVKNLGLVPADTE